ncbi:MAG: hypothetical protein ACK41O_04980 [Runella zeae]
MNDEQNTQEALLRLIDKVHRQYETWYAKVSKRNHRVWYSLQLVSLLCGFLTSIFVAFQTKATWTPNIKLICAIIPLIGSLASTLVLQFKIFETWRLREEGRISFHNLVNYSNSELLKCKTPEDFQQLFETITQKTNELENEQSSKFFSLYGSNFIASFTPKKI